jgi:hypothetical protein
MLLLGKITMKMGVAIGTQLVGRKMINVDQILNVLATLHVSKLS